MVRARLDYTWFPEYSVSGGGASASAWEGDLDMIQVGATFRF